MKTTRNIIAVCLLSIIGITTFSSCQKSCIKDRPKNVKPIDWNNYNDVSTVFWNYCIYPTSSSKATVRSRVGV